MTLPSRILSWTSARLAVFSLLAPLAVAFAVVSTHAAPPPDAQKFSVSFPKERSAQPLDGRLLLILSNDPSEEPRMQISLAPRTQMIFGVDVSVDDTRGGTRMVWRCAPRILQ